MFWEEEMSSHSFSKIWIHYIWETLDHEYVFDKDVRLKVSKFLFEYAKEKDIFMKVNFVNNDHVHILIELPTNLTIEECIKLFKGASSHFINQNRLINAKFNWGRGYGAFSVSASQLVVVEKYIRDQEEHHRKKSFSEEYSLFLEKYNNLVNG